MQLILRLAAIAVLLASIHLELQAEDKDGYRVRIHYRISGSAKQRLREYDAMLARFKSAGFDKAPGLEGEELFADQMTGTISARGADKLNLEEHVRTIEVFPTGYTLPTAAETPVLLRLYVTRKFGSGRQQHAANQARELLKPLGFQETVGHDHRGHTRLLGWLPAGRLPVLTRSETQISLTVPLLDSEGAVAVRAPAFERVDVIKIPEGLGPSKEPTPTPVAREQERISADLRTYVAELKDEDKNKALRVEVVLGFTPADNDSKWRLSLTTPPAAMTIEGRIGPIVTGLIGPSLLESLAAKPEVSTIRLPQSSRPFALPPFDANNPAAFPADLVALNQWESSRPRRTARVQIRPERVSAVIAEDFRGFERFTGKLLPARTHFIDLTAERHADLQADPLTGPANAIGEGTRLALFWLQKNPADELFLIRIDPASPYQVEDAARYVRGGEARSEPLGRRQEEVRIDRKHLESRRLELRIERRLALENFGTDETSRAAREAYQKKQQEFDREEAALEARERRLLRLLKQIERLHKVSAVLVGLRWLDGHPSLPRAMTALPHLDRRLLDTAAWFQAMPRSYGQVWTGLFRDDNHDGAMEFTAASPPEEVNFLAWKPHAWPAKDAASARELPAGAVVHLNLQWREVHSPEWKGADGDDVYRKPVAPLGLILLRQLDPTGKTLPPDLFEVAARSTELPDRLENHPRFAVYQSTLRFQVPEKSGRYGVRIEGAVPESTLPATAARLPNQQAWELHPKLRADVVDPVTRAKGLAVFERGEQR